MQNTLPAVEGLTPLILWYTLAGFAGISALVILCDKLAEVFRGHRRRRECAEARGEEPLRNEVSRLGRRLDAMDNFIRDIDRRFDRDNLRLNSLEISVSDIDRGINALARAELAHIQHDLTGNHSDNLGRAEKEITNYLTRKGE